LKTIVKVYGILFLLAVAVNADSTKSIKSEQYVALTGGTNGFGAKYSYCIGPVSMDIGIPFLYLTGRTKEKDTIDIINQFKVNSYLSANLILFKKERSTVSGGVACVVEMGFNRDRKRVDTVYVKYVSNDFGFNYYFGPIFEYNQRGKNNNKLFGAQLFPVKFKPGARKTFTIDIGVQLNFFLKKIGSSLENEYGILHCH
jgi:hypothetical protein